jgi:hypothetical protein
MRTRWFAEEAQEIAVIPITLATEPAASVSSCGHPETVTSDRVTRDRQILPAGGHFRFGYEQYYRFFTEY